MMQPDDVPTLDVEIERRPFEFQDHDWRQEGYTLICDSCPHVSSHGTSIKVGQMLVGKRGEWAIVAEGARMKQ